MRLIQVVIVVAVLAGVMAGVLESAKPAYKLSVGGKNFSVVVADDENERTTGLSSTKTLGANEGMLFVFDHQDYWPIWMQGMNYPIDIVWLDSSKQVINVERNVSPQTFPKDFLPNRPALYALEVAAGVASGVAEGQQAEFDLGN